MALHGIALCAAGSHGFTGHSAAWYHAWFSMTRCEMEYRVRRNDGRRDRDLRQPTAPFSNRGQLHSGGACGAGTPSTSIWAEYLDTVCKSTQSFLVLRPHEKSESLLHVEPSVLVMLTWIQNWFPVTKAHFRSKTFFVNDLYLRGIEMSPTRPIQRETIVEVERHEVDEFLVAGFLPDLAMSSLGEAFTRLHAPGHTLPEAATGCSTL